MIVVEMAGGVGNQLFQYAAARVAGRPTAGHTPWTRFGFADRWSPIATSWGCTASGACGGS